MTRVLHLRSTQGLYGADRALLALAKATKGPFEALVGSVVTPGREDALGAEAKKNGLDALRFQSRTQADVVAALDVADWVQRERIGLLHAHDYKSLALALLAGTAARVPVVATYHGDTKTSLKVKAYESFARALGNGTRGVVAVSKPLANALSKWVRAANVVHIANGIPAATPVTDEERKKAREELGLSADEPVVAYVGRLSPEKGPDVLCDALSRMPGRPKVLVAGDGPMRGQLEQSAVKLNLKLLGFVSNPRAVYAACDLVVMPSRTEGLPLVALEAMTHGRCVLATSVGEVPEVLADGAGHVVAPEDPQALAEAMTRLLADPGLRGTTEQKAIERVKARYGVETMAEAYAEKLYGPALEKRGASFPMFKRA